MHSRDVAAEALRLRAWARRHLGGQREPAPDVSARAWHIFLRAERCAALLHESVSAARTAVSPVGTSLKLMTGGVPAFITCTIGTAVKFVS